MHYLSLAGLTAFTTAINLPFGFLRSKSKQYSFQWFLYIHMPIPLIYILRRMLLLKPIIIPLLLCAAIIGQIWGAKMNQEKGGNTDAGKTP